MKQITKEFSASDREKNKEIFFKENRILKYDM